MQTNSCNLLILRYPPFRKGRIVVNRGPLGVNPETGKEEFDQETCFKGRVIDRVYPGGKFISSSLSKLIKCDY